VKDSGADAALTITQMIKKHGVVESYVSVSKFLQDKLCFGGLGWPAYMGLGLLLAVILIAEAITRAVWQLLKFSARVVEAALSAFVIFETSL